MMLLRMIFFSILFLIRLIGHAHTRKEVTFLFGGYRHAVNDEIECVAPPCKVFIDFFANPGYGYSTTKNVPVGEEEALSSSLTFTFADYDLEVTIQAKLYTLTAKESKLFLVLTKKFVLTKENAGLVKLDTLREEGTHRTIELEYVVHCSKGSPGPLPHCSLTTPTTTITKHPASSTTSKLCPPDKFCVNQKDGWYGNPSDLSQFFSCSNGKATPCQQCPTTLTFHAQCVQCLSKSQQCPTIKSTTQTAPTHTTTQITTSPTDQPENKCPNFCKGKTDSVYANPSNRHQFFKCINGNPDKCVTCVSDWVFREDCHPKECKPKDEVCTTQQLPTKHVTSPKISLPTAVPHEKSFVKEEKELLIVISLLVILIVFLVCAMIACFCYRKKSAQNTIPAEDAGLIHCANSSYSSVEEDFSHIRVPNFCDEDELFGNGAPSKNKVTKSNFQPVHYKRHVDEDELFLGNPHFQATEKDNDGYETRVSSNRTRPTTRAPSENEDRSSYSGSIS